MDAPSNGKAAVAEEVTGVVEEQEAPVKKSSSKKTIRSKAPAKEKPTNKESSKKTVSAKSLPVKSVGKKVSKKDNSKSKAPSSIAEKGQANSPYPRHALDKSFRIPKAVLDQNAGRECSEDDAARFLGLAASNGMFRVEVSSATKYGLIERPSPGNLKPTELAKRIIRPQSPEDEINGLRECILKAPVISDVYKHYRGENIPDRQFFENTLVDTFKIPQSNVSDFISIFIESLQAAKLLENTNGKQRVIDVASDRGTGSFDAASELKKLSKAAAVSSSDSCFVVMPFASPLGDYYAKIYEPAIQKAGLRAVRADDDIFGTGKIIDQIWTGITGAKVLIAELTQRNPNVFYELGLAHALKKPVVLVSSNEQDVPFDLKHIRVIYYEKDDPFWGQKLIDKVAENILSAIANPEEAILFEH